MEIQIEHQPNAERLQELGVSKWLIWTKEVSTFPWTYDSQETCYFLAGDVVVTPSEINKRPRISAIIRTNV
jgi:uncharacterized cupin superfamily protein